jgi:chemotaxis family two-component system response regulator Rcp1
MQESVADRFILVIDHNADHAQTIERVFQEHPDKYHSVTLSNGLQALDFLCRRGDYTAAPRPDLILLDLDLPGKDGRALLADIKADASLKRIPTIILTLSDNAEDIFRTYADQGNCYVLKATDLDQLTHTIRCIEDFWLDIVTLPLE